jgi:cytochrome c-type biogenesis protein CcmH/NrfF
MNAIKQYLEMADESLQCPKCTGNDIFQQISIYKANTGW